MLTSHDVGHRVSVRRLVEGGRTDVLGHLLDVTADRLEVLARGAVVALAASDVTAAKVVPAATPRRGWEVPHLSAAEMQRICWAGWPAREHELLGDWVRRAHGGITGRANSTLAVGDPGVPVDEALALTSYWYADRGLPPLVQLPLVEPSNAALEDAGWRRQHVTVVQVAPVAAVLAQMAPRADLRAVVEPVPGSDWCALMHDLDPDTAGHLAILTGPPMVGFATLYRGDEPVGIGRISVEGAWCGVTSVDVAPTARRQRIGSAVMASLLGWAQRRGASSSYLQVRSLNAAALRLYDALGYVTHHPYGYRAPETDPLG
ncbi:MAG: GNAT family N-acetyltransferase [Sporichthyaceae bacterium]